MKEIAIVIGIFVLRLGVPLAITLAMGYLLRRLDAKWEAEAIAQRKAAQFKSDTDAELTALKAKNPCWEVKGCTETQKAKCPACKLLDIPCWVARLRTAGKLPTECYNCGLFYLSTA